MPTARHLLALPLVVIAYAQVAGAQQPSPAPPSAPVASQPPPGAAPPPAAPAPQSAPPAALAPPPSAYATPAAPAPTSGDIPRFHDRFYLRLSLGGGTAMSSGSFEPDNGYSLDLKGGGLAFDLSIGGTPVPGFVIGGDYIYQQVAKPHYKLSLGDASVEGDAGSDIAFGLFGIFADWFPDPHGGFHAGATLGYAIFSAVDENGNVNDNTAEKGFGGALRVGYDFWVADQWSLGLLGQFVGARVSSDEQLGTTEHDTVTSFGLLVTGLYH